jgi:hypothetical protein
VSDWKVLVQQVDDGKPPVTVWASEIRGAATVEEAVARFVQGFESRPDQPAPGSEEE